VATESEVMESWRKFWLSCFPDCPPTDKNLLLIRKQWKGFASEQIREAMKATQKKRSWEELRLYDDKDTLEGAISRYCRGVLNKMAASPAKVPGVSTPAAAADSQQRQLAAERAAREKAEGEAARLKALLAEQLKHRDISVDAYCDEQAREMLELAATGVITI